MRGDQPVEEAAAESSSREAHGSPENFEPSAPPTTTRVVETHISIILFVGDRVYKVRKPVSFGFVDFSDRRHREVDCHREVDLNRRLSPDVYLGVADVMMDGHAVEHAVVMRRMPPERALAALVRAGSDIDAWLEQVAALLSSFHAGAARSPAISALSTRSALERKWHANFRESGQFVGDLFDSSIETQIQTLVGRWLRGSDELLADRISHGYVCDGHGDLQAEDVFCLDDGVRILDCLEFSDELRYGDVCADVAFLAMDLERLGRPDLADLFVSAYELHAGEPLPKSLLHHYIAQYAYIRAKVAGLRSQQGAGPSCEVGDLQRLALRHLRCAQFVVVLVGGLPGSGKSTLAAGLANDTGWALLRSDEIRQEVVAPSADRYSAEGVAAVYAEMLRRARGILVDHQSVILDATWIDEDERRRASQVALELGADVIALCCTSRESIAISRIDMRSAMARDPSEATVAVRSELVSRFDPWPEAVLIDTSSATPADEVETALQVLTSH